MSDRKTIRPDQLQVTTTINDEDIFILFQHGQYKAIEYSFLKTLFGGGGGDGIVRVDSFTLPGTQASYPIPAKVLIEKVVITPPSNVTVKIGTSSNTDDVLPESNLLANTSAIFDLNFYSDQSKTFYISGFSPNTKFQFLKVLIQQQ